MLAEAVGIAPRAKEVYSVLKERIRFMSPGVPLTSMLDLRNEFQVSQGTIEKAFSALESQGFIERRSRKGVFVADRLSTGEIAIVVRPQILESDSAASYRLSCAALTEAMHAENEALQVKMHLGRAVPTGSEFVASLDLLTPTVLPQLRGVFSFHDLFGLEDKLISAGVPVVNLHGRGGRYHVNLDQEGFFRQAIDHLVGRGVSKVGLLWFLGATEYTPAPRNWAQEVLAMAEKKGVECRPEWMLNQVVGIRDSGVSESQGYELFKQLWSQAERPEGLIIYDDVLCKGVLRAILELGLKLPDDLSLISYTNKGIALPFSKLVTSIEFDMKKRGSMGVRMIEALLHGNEPAESKVLISGKLIEGETT